MARGDYQSASGHKPNNAYVPALVNPPVIFIAPSARTVSGGEIWMAVSCDDANYGGCIVHASNDGATYTQIGKFVGQSTHGVLTAALASATGTDTTHTLAIDVHLSRQTMTGVSQTVADNHDSFCYVGGEFLAYRDSAMTGTGLYSLSYLHRGLYDSTPGASSGAKFALCNDALFKYRFNKNLVGSTIYLKFQGFNGVGAGLQEMSALTAYTFAVTADGGIKALLSDLVPITSEISTLTGTVAGLVDGSLAVMPLMYGGFNEDIVYNTGDNKVPDFLTDADGDLYYY
jgi:hypothetical protein